MTDALDCCIVGGGPAGMVLGLLLARVGLTVTVLESQPNFDRDFRGDTIHASTLEMLDQIGLADGVLAIPHARLHEFSINAGAEHFRFADFTHLPSAYPFIAIMPQVQFLEFLAREAARYPGFSCLTRAAVTGLSETDGRVCGVRYRSAGEETTLKANLVVAADGRFSRIRKLAGVSSVERAAPMDVCWFRLPREPDDGHDAGGFFFGRGRLLICIPRVDEWQIGYVFPKGDFTEVREAGIDAFRADIAETAGWLAGRVNLIRDFSEVHLLNVLADCLERWFKPGLLFIGDAAHVMSPVGGVGINAAISDAVEAANVLAYEGDLPAMSFGPADDALLREIQKRRVRPTRIIQTVQARVQNLLVQQALTGKPFSIPGPVRLLQALPGLRQLPIRIFALGVSRTRLRA